MLKTILDGDIYSLGEGEITKKTAHASKFETEVQCAIADCF